jgi:predicted metal-binding membrane protein
MTEAAVRAPSPPGSRPYLLRVTPQVAVLLVVAAVAWTATIVRAADMGNGMGTMAVGAPAFAGVWVLMMAAMMLPSVAPLASMYSRSVRSRRGLRLTLFAGGYLLVWGSTAIPAYALLRVIDEFAEDHRAGARAVAVGLFTIAGLYQLSPLKEACLRRCRSPLALLLHYGGYRGRIRDLRAAVHHGLWCLGCCWALFALFIALGAMNLVAMVAVTAVVLVEKLSVNGPAVSRLVGVACLALAVAVAWQPDLAPGLVPDEEPSMATEMGG